MYVPSQKKGGKSGTNRPLDRVLGRKDLVLLFVVAVANLNMVPPIAAAGPTSLYLWLIAIVLFFWPQGVAVAELAQKWPGEGGIYLWSKRSFGEGHGFLAGWCYWLSNVFYLPTVLLSCVGVGVYVFGPSIQRLADDHTFTACASIGLILFLLLLNIRGLQLGKWMNNLGGAGTILGAGMVCLLAVMTVRNHGSALHLSGIRPHWADWRLLASFGTICYGLVGLDLASIMGDEIREPKKILPSAIFWGGSIAALIYLGTTASMLVAMPQADIGILGGILQAIHMMATHIGWAVVITPIALLECVSILGTGSAWFSGAARLPFVAGIDRYLPASIGKVHTKYHTPYVALLLFAGLSTFLIGASFWGSSVGEAYLTMLDLAVILQLLPCGYMYGALLKHAIDAPQELHANRLYLILNAVAGLIAVMIGVAVAFIPSRQVNSIWLYECKLIAACVLVFGSAMYFYWRSRRKTIIEDWAGGIEPAAVEAREAAL